MRLQRTPSALLLAAAVTLATCGGTEARADPDGPVLQVRSEGGFAPLEYSLGRGPAYTVLGDRRLIFEGPIPASSPGPLLPNFRVTTMDEGRMADVLDLVERIGLPDMQDERDDSAADSVADATTEVVTFWDEAGEHSYAVYALGLFADRPSRPETAAFAELLDVLGSVAGAGDSSPFEAARVRVISMPVDHGSDDTREWPLTDTDFSGWQVVTDEWRCRSFAAEVLETFEDATQATRWIAPTGDGSLVQLLVRPLHPGEPSCPA